MWLLCKILTVNEQSYEHTVHALRTIDIILGLIDAVLKRVFLVMLKIINWIDKYVYCHIHVPVCLAYKHWS